MWKCYVQTANAEKQHNSTFLALLSHKEHSSDFAWLTFNVKQFYTNIRNSSHIDKPNTNTCSPQIQQFLRNNNTVALSTPVDSFPSHLLFTLMKLTWSILRYFESYCKVKRVGTLQLKTSLILKFWSSNGDESSASYRCCVLIPVCGISMTMVHLKCCILSYSWWQMG